MEGEKRRNGRREGNKRWEGWRCFENGGLEVED